MNRINLLLLCIAVSLAALTSSCGDDSEKLLPGDPEVNYFDVDPADNSQSAALRKDFYKQTGIYLLYNDLLRTYKDPYGVEHEERVEFGWDLTTNNESLKYTMTELSDEEKTLATQLVMKYFVPYINVKGGSFRPYSILLTKNLISNKENSRYMDPTDFLSCWRCLCINTDSWLDADDETVRSLGRSLLKSMLESELNPFSDELEPFVEEWEDYYDAYAIVDIIPEWEDEQNIEWIYELGFLDYRADKYGDVEYDEFLSKKNDLKAFLKEMTEKSEDEFMEQWGDYPKIVERYNILKEVFSNLGVDLNAVK